MNLDSDDATVRITEADERGVISRALMRSGAPQDTSSIQADWLVEADLRGQASHGIRRLSILVERVRRALIDPHAVGTIHRRSTSLSHIDGERGFGPVVGSRAMDHALELARHEGIGLVSVSNANHLGILAPYVEQAANQGVIGVALTTSEALVHPWLGRQALVGTNPIAVAVPAEPDPVVLDMATGVVSMGRILACLENGTELAPGWALDDVGLPTTDPARAIHGAISPFGEAKGYALGLTLEILVSSLTASALGSDIKGTLDAESVCNKGDVFICIDPQVVPGRSHVADVSRYLDLIRQSAPQDPAMPVRVPGDRMRAERAIAQRDGMEIATLIWDAALDLADGPRLRHSAIRRPDIATSANPNESGHHRAATAPSERGPGG